MSNDTYIKLYRKMLDNRTLWRDHTSVRVLIWLLLRADYKTGIIETGRFAASEGIGINPNTLYSSLKRLEKMKIINIKSNNKYSVISILNWSRYQPSNNTTINNKSTTNQHYTRNKEIKNNNNKLLYSDDTFDKNAARRELAGLKKFSSDLKRIGE
jgi:hypothetical protein